MRLRTRRLCWRVTAERAPARSSSALGWEAVLGRRRSASCERGHRAGEGSRETTRWRQPRSRAHAPIVEPKAHPFRSCFLFLIAGSPSEAAAGSDGSVGSNEADAAAIVARLPGEPSSGPWRAAVESSRAVSGAIMAAACGWSVQQPVQPSLSVPTKPELRGEADETGGLKLHQRDLDRKVLYRYRAAEKANATTFDRGKGK